MNLDETQKKKVTAWIAEGLKIADIQKRLESDFGLRPTYLEVRFLVDDLKLVPIDPTPPPQPKTAAPSPLDKPDEDVAPQGLGASKVRISVDQITRAGAMISGKVTFSDGKKADWYLDQMGRLGLAPAEKGYKPSAADLQDFQTSLQDELQRMG